MNGILLSWTIPTHLVMGSLHGPMTLILTLMSLGITPKGQYKTLSILDDSSSTLAPCPTFMANQHAFRTYQHDVTPEAPDNDKFWPYFGWVNVDTVQKTMEPSTQWGVSLPNTFPMKKHLKSRNPALNIPRRHEAVATDTVFSDTPAVDSGVKQAQVLVRRDTLVADAYPMKSGKQFVNTLEDNIRRQAAMDKLLSEIMIWCPSQLLVLMPYLYVLPT